MQKGCASAVAVFHTAVSIASKRAEQNQAGVLTSDRGVPCLGTGRGLRTGDRPRAVTGHLSLYNLLRIGRQFPGPAPPPLPKPPPS